MAISQEATKNFYFAKTQETQVKVEENKNKQEYKIQKAVYQFIDGPPFDLFSELNWAETPLVR